MLARATAALLLLATAATPAALAEEPSPDAAARWHDLATALFPHRAIADGSALLTIDAPTRAEDAALVPITIHTTAPVHGLYLVIDNNPAPMAAHFTFGAAADASELRLRVRVDQYTPIHAIAETQDGRLFAIARFVKASGGCSAPSGASTQDALRGVGQMKLRPLQSQGSIEEAQLLIRHPNFNGMQMDQVTRLYTPARYVNAVDVTTAGQEVFHLDSDISLATDPAITFRYRPAGPLTATVHDTSGAVFTKTFEPAGGS